MKISFDSHYSAIFSSRWEALRQSLLGPVRYQSLNFGGREYHLDVASWHAAQALDVQCGDRVLDLCAAPGGKSLVIASKLQGQGFLQCNDRSADRRVRLHRVLEESLPESWRQNVLVSGYDATKFGMHQKECWDRILLDAPCSSERHVLGSPHHLEQWSLARSKHLAVQQFAMVASAIDSLKIGGIMIYSTCALDPQENDGVMQKMLKKRKERVEIIPVFCPLGESTELGWQILPDHSEGAGPIYFCKIRKII